MNSLPVLLWRHLSRLPAAYVIRCLMTTSEGFLPVSLRLNPLLLRRLSLRSRLPQLLPVCIEAFHATGRYRGAAAAAVTCPFRSSEHHHQHGKHQSYYVNSTSSVFTLFGVGLFLCSDTTRGEFIATMCTCTLRTPIKLSVHIIPIGICHLHVHLHNCG